MYPRFNLDKVYKDKESSIIAKKLAKDKKRIPKSLFHEGLTTIYLSVSYKNKYYKQNTGVKIDPSMFDVKSQKVTGRSEHDDKLQSLLNQIKERFIFQYYDLKKNGAALTENKIKEMLMISCGTDAAVEEEPLTWQELYDQFFSWKKTAIKNKTHFRYTQLKSNLISFEKKQKTRINIHQINEIFAQNFSSYLADEFNQTHNTIVKYLKSLKTFCRFLLENGISSNTKFLNIKTTELRRSVFSLSLSEIDLIRKVRLNDPQDNEIRDAFIFLCFTGQRFGDIINLTFEDIIEDDGQKYWRLFQSKGKQTIPVHIPLLDEVLEIISKRNCKNTQQPIFTLPTNQQTNIRLKEIAKISGITGIHKEIRFSGPKTIEIKKERHQMVTSHIGRKSFVSIAFELGMDIKLIQSITNHSSIKVLEDSYLKISKTQISKALKNSFNHSA